MKRHITCILFIMNLWMVAHTKQMNLQRALDLKLVKAIVRSLGSYQGFCIQMHLINLGTDSLCITVEAGRRLNSMDDSQQDILITQQEIVGLGKSESKSFPVKGYCCQASNSAPTKGAVYSVNKMAEANLVNLASYMNGNKNDMQTEQNAVWAVSDDRPVSMIFSKKDTVLSGLKIKVCEIKGITLPWYSFTTWTLVFRNGAMQTFPLRLRGKLDFSNDKMCYTTLRILDENGSEVSQIIHQWSYPGNSQKYDLDIPVKGLAKGKYTVELITPEKRLAVREFEI